MHGARFAGARRWIAGLAAVLIACAALASPALARVQVHFQSFNGSVVIGRFPHAFVVFEGRLDDTGEVIDENFGFSAKEATAAILGGPAEHMIMVEKPKYINSTNRHFTVEVSDATYRRMKAEVIAWRDAPGKYYDLDTRNCIHFVGRMAELAGLTVDYPKKLLRRPKAWLNHIAALNPQLHAEQIR